VEEIAALAWRSWEATGSSDAATFLLLRPWVGEPPSTSHLFRPGTVAQALWARFDLEELTFANVCFAGLDSLVRLNEEPSFHFPAWWGDGDRPEELLAIAQADGTLCLLEVETDAILAWEHEQDHWSQATKVADDLELFVRGLGTVFYVEGTDPDRVAEAVGAEGPDWWRTFAGGGA